MRPASGDGQAASGWAAGGSGPGRESGGGIETREIRRERNGRASFIEPRGRRGSRDGGNVTARTQRQQQHPRSPAPWTVGPSGRFVESG